MQKPRWYLDCFLVAGGCVGILMGVNQIHKGIFVWRNGYLQTVHAGGAIGAGALLILFAFYRPVIGSTAGLRCDLNSTSRCIAHDVQDFTKP